jgi:prepilin-type N-terminal cleavage/methylation domain-containing protein/prepilin-type processing-associated H-X9-DG protein
MLRKNGLCSVRRGDLQVRFRVGFTLIELLVVIAIIAILAAILFPVFSQARDKARQAACTSNLKQIGLAFMQYSQDYDGFYPSAYSYPNTWGVCPHLVWMDFCQPYIRNTQIFACPSTIFSFVRDGGRAGCPPLIAMWGDPPLGTSTNPWRLGYQFNEGYDEANEWSNGGPVCPDPYGFTCYWGMTWREVYDPNIGATVMDQAASDAMIAEPATTIALGDGNPNCNLAPTSSTIAIFRIFRDTDHESPRGGCREADGTKRGRLERRHSKGFNLLYADGHVKWATRTRKHWWTRMADEAVFGGQ